MWQVSVISALLFQAQTEDKAAIRDVIDSPDVIIITGERLDQPIGRTASSVAAMTAEDIEKSNFDRASELLDNIPNLYDSAGSLGPSVRGQDSTGATRDLPAFLAGVRPRMALHIDGREASYHEFIFGAVPLWDIEQFEVFRTPQTISRGRNSIAGAVYLTTKDPSFEWEGSGRGMVGNYDFVSTSAAVSGPLIGDDLAIRVSFDGRWSRPTSEMKGIRTSADRDRNEHQQARVKLLFTPSGLPNLETRVSFTHTASYIPQAMGIRAPFKKREDPNATYGDFDIAIDALNLQGKWKFSSLWHAELQASTTQGDIERVAPPGLGETQTDYRDRAIELLLVRDTGPLRLQAGIHHARLRQLQDIDVSRLIGVAHFTERRTGTGIYMQAQADLGSRLSAEAALRYQIDKHRRTGGFEGFPQIDLDVDLTEKFLLPRASVALDIGRGWNIGLLALRATNAGGEVVPISLDEESRFDREWLWDAEFFVRGKFDGDRGHVEFNLFRNWIRELQRSETRRVDIPGIPDNLLLAKVINVPEARSQGAELSLQWASGRFSWRGALGYLDTKFEDVTGASQIEIGNEFARAPHWTGNLGVGAKLGDGWSLEAGIRANSKLYSDDANSDFGRVSGATYADLRIEKRVERMRIFAYARNLFDRFVITNISSPTFAVASDPRTVAIGIASDF